MENAHFDKNFLHQFRQDYIVYPCSDEHLYRDFLVRQFAGAEHEIPVIGDWLSGKTNSLHAGSGLISNMRKKDLPATGRLLRFVRDFNRFLCSCAGKEPFTAQYYHLLLADLKPFFSLMRSFREKLRLALLDKTAALLADKTHPDSARNFFDKDLDIIRSEMDEYTGQIWKYYDYFNYLLKEESGNGRAVAVFSQVEEYLIQLISLTEKVLISTELTQSMLGRWQEELTGLEMQALYN